MNKMKYVPKTLRVGGNDYSINYIDFKDELEPETYLAKFGWCDSSTHEIFVDNSRGSTQHHLNILLHELCHAVNFEYNIDDGAAEERVVVAQAAGWCSIWKNNKNKMLKLMENNV